MLSQRIGIFVLGQALLCNGLSAGSRSLAADNSTSPLCTTYTSYKPGNGGEEKRPTPIRCLTMMEYQQRCRDDSGCKVWNWWPERGGCKFFINSFEVEAITENPSIGGESNCISAGLTDKEATQVLTLPLCSACTWRNVSCRTTTTTTAIITTTAIKTTTTFLHPFQNSDVAANATDSRGKGCHDGYVDASACGKYDDIDFHAKDMCSSCQVGNIDSVVGSYWVLHLGLFVGSIALCGLVCCVCCCCCCSGKPDTKPQTNFSVPTIMIHSVPAILGHPVQPIGARRDSRSYGEVQSVRDSEINPQLSDPQSVEQEGSSNVPLGQYASNRPLESRNVGSKVLKKKVAKNHLRKNDFVVGHQQNHSKKILGRKAGKPGLRKASVTSSLR